MEWLKLIFPKILSNGKIWIDYFLNIKNLRSGQSIRVGSQVKFDTEESQRGPQAKNVTLY